MQALATRLPFMLGLTSPGHRAPNLLAHGLWCNWIMLIRELLLQSHRLCESPVLRGSREALPGSFFCIQHGPVYLSASVTHTPSSAVEITTEMDSAPSAQAAGSQNLRGPQAAERIIPRTSLTSSSFTTCSLTALTASSEAFFKNSIC
jgi:hypothetical protein